MDKEYLMKILLLISIVNFIPLLIYAVVSLSSGELNPMILYIMVFI